MTQNEEKPKKGYKYLGPTKYGRQNAFRIMNTDDAWDILHARAKKLGLSDKEVAMLIGLTTATIVNWNSKRMSPSLKHIQDLCQNLGAELEINIRIRRPTPMVRDILSFKKKERENRRKSHAYQKSIAWKIKKERELREAARRSGDAS